MGVAILGPRTMAEISEFYTTACSLDKAPAQRRAELNKFISGIVGYPCTILCEVADPAPAGGSVNIAVVSKQHGVTTDWLILQANGALGLQKFLYAGPETYGFLEVVCERLNAAHGLVYVGPSK